ncbi:MAG: hypothetical protein LH645_10470 [Actinomycetia bacterium]|nr:hypothetical protein [Actinomycetes bacterium]
MTPGRHGSIGGDQEIEHVEAIGALVSDPSSISACARRNKSGRFRRLLRVPLDHWISVSAGGRLQA